MQCSRLYADAEGESHFDDFEIPLTTTDFTPPAPPIAVSEPVPTQRAIFLNVGKNWNGISHPAPVKALFVFTRGVWEVTASDGEVRQFGSGDILRVEDTEGKGHITRLLGDAEGAALLVQLP